jgi:hypothetical protein
LTLSQVKSFATNSSADFEIEYIKIWIRKPNKRHTLLELQVHPSIDNPHSFDFTLLDLKPERPFHPVVDPQQIDPNLLKYWLRMCKTTRPLVQDSKPKVYHKIAGLKLVDVQTNRVIAAPANSTYIALSYVWGRTKQFRIENADFVTNASGGSYAQLNREELPCTIRDAIFVVESLGERYIWVDALCILEDGETEMRAMIHAMDRVYKNATLTIVAACGEDSNAGLPGLRLGSRTAKYVTGSVDGTHLVSENYDGDLSSYLNISTWGHRGWAYQEYVFSDLVLIFVNQHVYFESGNRVWSGFSPNRSVLGRRSNPITHSQLSFDNYAKHVLAYTKRSLTFEEDILNAFTAILQDHSARFATKFCWGLPTQHFPEALMWVYTSDVGFPVQLRRRVKRKGYVTFPSWSWAGWIGAVEFVKFEKPHFRAPKLVSNITWPWESGVHTALDDSIFSNSVLTINVDLGTLNSFHYSSVDDVHFCQLDIGKQWTRGSVECFLLAHVDDPAPFAQHVGYLHNYRLYDHVLLAVEKGEDGIYCRIGCFRVSEAFWATSDFERKQILLG